MKRESQLIHHQIETTMKSHENAVVQPSNSLPVKTRLFPLTWIDGVFLFALVAIAIAPVVEIVTTPVSAHEGGMPFTYKRWFHYLASEVCLYFLAYCFAVWTFALPLRILFCSRHQTSDCDAIRKTLKPNGLASGAASTE